MGTHPIFESDFDCLTVLEKMAEFKFALQLLKAAGGNQCVSPLNIAHALALVLLGTKDQTRDQVVKTLGHKNDAEAHDVLTKALKVIKEKNIATASARVFVQNGFQLKTEFQTAAEQKYGAPAEKVDFSNAEKCAATINNWVANNTKNMITELFSAGDIDPNMLVALCSALHFKGTWKVPFDAPFKDEFTLDGDKKVTTDFILKKSTFPINYSAELNCQVVELAYTNGTQMILVNPQYHDGLADVEKGLTDEKLRQLCDELDRSGDDEVEVKMPKFTLETTTDLKDTLEKLGIKKMFDPTGYLTEISHQPLSIGAAKHKVKIIVDEKGTEAAAATGMIAMMRMAPMPVLVHANHPFLFFIRHNGQTLFGGRFTTPE